MIAFDEKLWIIKVITIHAEKNMTAFTQLHDNTRYINIFRAILTKNHKYQPCCCAR